MPVVRQSVLYTDSKGVDHEALVTAVWSKTCINVAYVSTDEDKRDSWGRQLERDSSVNHVSLVGAHGKYWRFKGESSREYAPPIET